MVLVFDVNNIHFVQCVSCTLFKGHHQHMIGQQVPSQRSFQAINILYLSPRQRAPSDNHWSTHARVSPHIVITVNPSHNHHLSLRPSPVDINHSHRPASLLAPESYICSTFRSNQDHLSPRRRSNTTGILALAWCRPS